MQRFLIHEFAPLWLTIDRIGPFQERMEEIDFTDAGNEPCNLYLFLSKNGRGKTTALELMTALMGMLGFDKVVEMANQRHRSPQRPFNFEALDKGRGRAQLDLRVRYSIDSRENTAVLSLIAGNLGPETSLRFWDADALAQAHAKEWFRHCFDRSDLGVWGKAAAKDNWVRELNAVVAAAEDEPVGGFRDSNLTLPTLIYFSAYRNIVPIAESQERAISAPRDWNYRPVHAFRTEGGDWRDSLDNLLVWLKWLDDGRYERAIELVNAQVFAETSTVLKGVSKEPPEAIVIRDNQRHRLDALSSGEKSLVQLVLRLGSHMTRNTILLIDEPEAHLHDQWKYRLYTQLKTLAQENYPGLTVIVATHSPEIMTSFAIEVEEKNLRKGGFFIETPYEESRAKAIKEEAERLYGNT